MIGYTELYELLRKEKYSEQLQPLPKKFIEEFKSYIDENKQQTTSESNLFADSIAKSKKQFENAISIFRELMLKRKKKLLNLVFVATETGIMKRDYENMLPFEKESFEKLVKTFEESDKEVTRVLNGKDAKKEEKNKMILFRQEVDEFVDHEGNPVGPFKSGSLANLNSEIANILVKDEKASFVDEQ